MFQAGELAQAELEPKIYKLALAEEPGPVWELTQLQLGLLEALLGRKGGLDGMTVDKVNEVVQFTPDQGLLSISLCLGLDVVLVETFGISQKWIPACNGWLLRIW